jgi:hypothetical protein
MKKFALVIAFAAFLAHGALSGAETTAEKLTDRSAVLSSL